MDTGERDLQVNWKASQSVSQSKKELHSAPMKVIADATLANYCTSNTDL